MPIAFREWAVTVRALSEGEQLLTIRRANPARGDRPLQLPHERFFLYPTFDRQPGDLVRDLAPAGAAPGPRRGRLERRGAPMQSFITGAPIQQPDRVRIRAWAEVTGQFTLYDRRCVDALSPFCVWTPDYATKRLGWRAHQPLDVLLLRTYRIPRPVTVKVRDEYLGPGPWIELQRELPFDGTPVLADSEFDRASDAIRSITAQDDQAVLV